MTKKKSTTEQVLTIVGQTVLGLSALTLFMLITCSVVGAYYPETLEAMHLDWLSVPLRGIYADCSLPENRGTGFCRPKEDHTYDMRRAGIPEKQKAVPFTLYKTPY